MSIDELRETDTNSIVRHINNLVSWVNAVVHDVKKLYTQTGSLFERVNDIEPKVDGLQQLYGRVQMLEEKPSVKDEFYKLNDKFILSMAGNVKEIENRLDSIEKSPAAGIADDKLVTLREILLWVGNESMREFQDITIKVKYVMAVSDVIKVNGKREYGRCKVKMADGTSFHIKGEAKEIIKLIWGDKS